MTAAAALTRSYGEPESILKKLVLIILAFGPLIMFPWFVWWGWQSGLMVPVFDVPLILIFNYWRGLGITLIFHRNLTHSKLATGKWDEGEGFALHPAVRMFFMVGGHLAIQTDGQSWGWLHRRHHAESDGPRDPHSPWRYVDDEELKPGMPGYRTAFWKGVMWAHFGWMLRSWTPEEKFYKSFLNDAQLQRCRKHYGKIIAFSYSGPLLIAMLIKLPLMMSREVNPKLILWSIVFSGLAAGIFNIAFVHHITWCVNSLCHTFGVRPFTKSGTDRSSDRPFWEFGIPGKIIALVFEFVSNGEGDHAGHHAFPGSPKHALAWRYHLDMTWYLIKVLAFFRLAKIRGVPSDQQIREKLVPGWKHAPV
jgi:stearoyl-CoA desaturase (delta-9 desaturase)